MAAAGWAVSGSGRWPALARCCWRAEMVAYFSAPAASNREAQQREDSTRRRSRTSQFIRSHIPPRTERMAVDQDWSSVYPTAAAFKPASVPLPIRMGYPVKGGVPPPKEGNLELIKIPNFLHLTPPAIKKHCAALRDFCTEWPSALDSDEKCEQHFPIEIETVDYVSAGTSIRNPKARIVTLRVKLSNLNLDDHAKKKLIKLVGARYCKDTDVLTIIIDRCPLRRQNYDYGIHLLTVLYHESWNQRMAWVEKDLKDQLLSTPVLWWGHQPLDQAAQSHIQPGLECLQGWGIHNLLGQPVPVCHHPLGEKLPANI